MIKKLLPCLAILLLTGCTSNSNEPGTSQQINEDGSRPALHFTPPSGWMNDPNGMVFHDGRYHLFYQHNPADTVWGPMHWGHAVSQDLVNWTHKPIAIYPDENGTIFSGSAVLDKDNTSGLGSKENPPLVAMFTYHDAEREKAGYDDFQTQGIAYSVDNGESWHKVADNPVIQNPGKRVFRDPKVTWHAATQQWVMVLTQGNTIGFYTSDNLLDWQYQSEFGEGLGAHGGVWECPDLIRMRVPGTDEYRYVLIVSLVPGGPNGGSGTQYFIGDFDGKQFTLAPHEEQRLQPEPAIWPEGKVFDDFETGYGKWQVEGSAFGTAPAAGAIEPQMPVSGFDGKALVNSFRGGDEPTGRMKSTPFTISSPFINFKIAGGRTSATALQLWVGDQKVAEKSGNETEQLIPASFDVRAYQGEQAYLVISDTATGGWGHILIDDIRFSNQRAIARKERAHWLDYGPDNYAGVTFSNFRTSDGHPIFMGWANNWSYANEIPASSWRGFMSLPRELYLYQQDGGVQLGNKPVKSVSELFKGMVKNSPITLGENTRLFSLAEAAATFRIQLEVNSETEQTVSVELSNEQNEVVVLRIESATKRVVIDRSRSGNTAFNPLFSELAIAPFRDEAARLPVEIIYDKGILEVFINNGKTSLTTLVFPQQDYQSLTLSSDDTMAVHSLTIESL